jgi:maltose-binding protein MalE
MKYLERLKSQKMVTRGTAKSAKTPFDSFDSTPDGIVFENRKTNKHPKKFKPVTPDLVKNFRLSRQWILKNLKELEAKGWTRKELFRAGQFKHPCGTWGPAWLSSWLDPDMMPGVGADGEIVFNFNKYGRQYRQTARKLPQAI